MSDSKNLKKLPWYYYLTLVLIYVSPILAFEFLGIATGIFTRSEYYVIVRSGLNLIYFLVYISY